MRTAIREATQVRMLSTTCSPWWKGTEMKWQCAGNGQLHQMTMLAVTNTLDCMHDQQIILREGGVLHWMVTKGSMCFAA